MTNQMNDTKLELRKKITRLQEANTNLENELHDLQQFVSSLQFISKAAKEKRTKESQDHLNWWLTNILQQTLTLLSAPEGSVLWLDTQTNELEFMIIEGASLNLLGTRLKIGEGIAGWVAKHKETVIVPDVSKDERFSSRLDEASEFETRSIVAAPLLGDNQLLGVVEVLNQSGDEPFSELHSAMLSLFCDFAGDILANIK